MNKEKNNSIKYRDVVLEKGSFTLPPVLIGTIFYQGETIMDRKTGINFSKEKAMKRIDLQISLSEKYKIPHLIEISGHDPESMRKYLEFYLENYSPPFVLGGSFEARKEGLKYLKEVGIDPQDFIYNAISNLKNKEEVSLLKEFNVDSVVVLVLGSENMTSTQKFSYITKKTQPNNVSIIQGLENLGIKNIWIDGGVSNLESLAHVLETQKLVSSALKLPVGTAPNNFLFKYSSPRLNKKFHTKFRRASIMHVASLYSNFIFYGAIEDAIESFSSAFQAIEFRKILRENNIKLIES